MTDYKDILLKLHNNLDLLREREAKYGGNPPLELVNQISDHQQAIALTEQAIAGELTETKWCEALQPLLVAIDSRHGEAAVSQIAIGNYIAQTTHGGTATVNITTLNQDSQQVSGNQYNASHDINITQTEKEAPAKRIWAIILGIFTIIGVIVTFFTVPQFNALVFPAPTSTPTPLVFTPATDDEILIIIATFYETAATKTNPHTKIRRAIEKEAKEITLLNTLRVEEVPTILKADEREAAEVLGKRYNASIVIWGEDTGVQVIVNFLTLKALGFTSLVQIEELQRVQLTHSEAYASFIVEDLPRQLTNLTFHDIAITYYSSNTCGYTEKVIQQTLNSTSSDTPQPTELYFAYFLRGLCHAAEADGPRKKLQAIYDYSKAINLNPEFAPAYGYRASAYAFMGAKELAIADLEKYLALDPNAQNRAAIIKTLDSLRTQLNAQSTPPPTKENK